MLVLSRKSGESIRISDDIVITVVKIQGNSIRLGIDAPRDVPIVRSELTPVKDVEAVQDATGNE